MRIASNINKAPESRNMIFLTDTTYAGWMSPAESALLEYNPRVHVDKYSASGVGFATSTSFQSVLTSHTTANATANINVTDIVVCGGFYDESNTEADIVDALDDFATYCKAQYPCAKVWIGMIAWRNRKDKAGLRKVFNAYSQCNDYGMCYMHNVQYVMHDYTYYASDNYTPNSTGFTSLGKHIAEVLMTGTTDVIRPLKQVTLTYASGISSVIFRVYEGMTNSDTYVTFFYPNFTPASGTGGFDATGAYEISTANICTVSNGYVNTDYFIEETPCGITGGYPAQLGYATADQVGGLLYLYLDSNKVCGKVFNLGSPAPDAYVKADYESCGTIHIDSMYC